MKTCKNCDYFKLTDNEHSISCECQKDEEYFITAFKECFHEQINLKKEKFDLELLLSCVGQHCKTYITNNK